MPKHPFRTTDAGSLTPYPEALQTVLKHCRPLGPEKVSLAKAAGRYLAIPVKARADSPRCEQSSMDGFAVRAADLAKARARSRVTLKIVGEMPTGGEQVLHVRPGQTVRVFTGGRLPRGADSVVIVEVVRAVGDEAVFTSSVAPGANIRPKGQEYRKGQEILPVGLRVTPPVIGVLASQGLGEATVGRVPAVTLITMGDELLAPGAKLTAGKIYDANGPALIAALRALGVRPVWHRRVCDRKDALKRSLAAALARSEVVITVGGASVGDHDHTADVRAELGIRTLFNRMAVKPGKPNIFGLDPGGVPVFSLPGNPVSALVGFHQLVKPALRTMMGSADPLDKTLPVALGTAVGKKPGRLNWLRARLVQTEDGLTADLTNLQDSHMLSGLACCDLLVEISREATGAEAGQIVPATLLDWER